MESRTFRLAKRLVDRRSSIDLPDTTFLGWKHFLAELNKFINVKVRKSDDGITFATLDGEPSPDEARVSLYTENSTNYGFESNRLISAVKYFVGEMGIKVVEQSQEDDSVILTLSGLSTFSSHGTYDKVRNPWMRKALMNGTAVDVRQIGFPVEPGVFRLTEFIPEVDYVDAETEDFIQSIGKDEHSGEMFASTDGRYYNNDDYDCIYLK